MDDKKIRISKDGLGKLQKELQKRKSFSRKNIADEIDKARQQGDLSENAAYKAALENKEFNETKIKELEVMIQNSQVVAKVNKGKVGLGSKISLLNQVLQKKVTYQLVDEQEADSSQSKISINSPLGALLIGKRVGQIVKLASPAGIMAYEILAIN